jgi:hypothetical protein
MTLRLWELGAAVVLIAMALLFAVAGRFLEAFALATLVAFAIANRAGIVETSTPGGWAKKRSSLLFVQVVALFSMYALAAALLVTAMLEHWSEDTRGAVATYALLGFLFLLYREFNTRSEKAVDYLRGSRAEERVGAQLNLLQADGWSVAHDLPSDGRGNIDHLAWGERGTYAIETKSGRFHRSQVGKIKASAAWAKRTYGARWVQPVICVCTDQPASPREQDGVWVLGADQIVEWLRSQPRTGSGLRAFPK